MDSAVLWAGGPGVYTKENWASQEEQTSRRHFSLASASTPISFYLELLPDFHSWWATIESWNKSFFLQVAFGHGVLSQQKKPN